MRKEDDKGSKVCGAERNDSVAAARGPACPKTAAAPQVQLPTSQLSTVPCGPGHPFGLWSRWPGSMSCSSWHSPESRVQHQRLGAPLHRELQSQSCSSQSLWDQPQTCTKVRRMAERGCFLLSATANTWPPMVGFEVMTRELRRVTGWGCSIK